MEFVVIFSIVFVCLIYFVIRHTKTSSQKEILKDVIEQKEKVDKHISDNIGNGNKLWRKRLRNKKK